MRLKTVLPILAALFIGCARQQAPEGEPAAKDWERIEYLSDHLAVAVSGGKAWLLTADGDIVASDDDPDKLKAMAETAYANFLDEEYSDWEEILEQYESLCNACIARQSSDELLGRLNTLRNRVLQAAGRMDPQQQDRFEAIRERYSKYRR